MYVCFNMISFSFSGGGGGVGRVGGGGGCGLWFACREITVSYHKINYLCILCQQVVMSMFPIFFPNR